MFVNARDSELSSLASNAAVELDLLINGEQTDVDAVRLLGERLHQTLDKPAPGQPARGLQVDTETEAVLGQAFVKTGEDPATILGNLFNRTERIADLLSSAKQGTQRSELEWQRTFCLALSQCAATFRQMILDDRPPHPYRRATMSH